MARGHGKKDDLDDLIRVLSHQLKSPVNAIESMLTMVLDGYSGDVDSKTVHYLKRAVSKTHEARQLISDLVHYEQFSGGHKLAFEQIDLAGLLAGIYGRSIAIAAEKNISLSSEIPKQMKVLLQGYRAGLESAFTNLIDNAIKYTGEGGKVTVSLEINTSSKKCIVQIRDTGRGIPREDLGHLYEPFFRSSSSKGSVAGTGLGLAIVKRAVSHHGGTVAADSAVGRGTTFTVTLPYAALQKKTVRDIRRKRVVIVGGVTAGPKAAARLRRLDESANITIIEKSELLSYAGCGIPSYVRGTVKSPKALQSTADNTLRDAYFFEAIKNITIFNKTEALRIDRKKKNLLVRDSAAGTERTLPYDILVLATGAASAVPPIKGIDGGMVYSLYNIEDAETIRRRFAEKPASDVYILGGGLVGVETAESLLMAGGRVTVLEKDAHILKLFDPDIALKIEHVLNFKGIKVVTGVTIKEIKHEGGRQSIVTDKGNFITDIIILSAGVKPNAALAVQSGLAIGANGGIKVNDFLRTSDPAIYAIGDCAESRHLVSGKYSYLPLGSISTKMGRIAADNIAGNKVRFSGSIGTTMFKIFDIQVARTGLTEKEAVDSGFKVESVVVAGLDKAHYEAGAEHVILKVIADRPTQRLLGAQGYGKGEAAKRIETLAGAIANRLTLQEIFMLDLGYYPAFNNPIDIAQTACLVLKNKIDGICATINLSEFERLQGSVRIVDVSPPQEYSFNSIPGSINIPLENLRQEGLSIDKKERVVLYSKTSSRAYQAYRYLHACGYKKLRVLEGGLVFWKK
jgi:NADPH-dependent 2,4-dienoyl-CoA reductase/sulfur reductase-like enzyme/rhodanese-related sulfurtransferase